MFIEGSVHWQHQQASEALLAEAHRLGFRGIIFTTVLEKLQANTYKTLKCSQTQIAQDPSKSRMQHGVWSDTEINQMDLHFKPAQASNILQIKRLHSILKGPEDSSLLHAYLRAQQNQSAVSPNGFDIVSAQISDEKTWFHVINQGQVDLIQLDLYEPRLPFPVKRSALGLAARNNMFFEVCLDKALVDPACCRYLFRNLPYITRYLPSAQIILTSGARTPMHLRAPTDLIALAKVLGFVAAQDAEAVVGHNVQRLLCRAAARRNAGPGYQRTSAPSDATMADA